jgi:16S rRNA processing protein RimM
MMKPETASPVLVAKIIKPHGIRGEVVLESWTDVEGRLENRAAFLLIDKGQVLKEIAVESRRFIMGRPVFKFAGVSSRTEAESLRNLELGIPEEELGELQPNQYFIFHLIGMDVLLKNGREAGKVQDVISTDGGDLLELENGVLVPFIDEICLDVDLEKKQIVIDPPEGLLAMNHES